MDLASVDGEWMCDGHVREVQGDRWFRGLWTAIRRNSGVSCMGARKPHTPERRPGFIGGVGVRVLILESDGWDRCASRGSGEVGPGAWKSRKAP